MMAENDNQDLFDYETDPPFVKISEGLYYCIDKELMEKERSRKFSGTFTLVSELGQDQ